MWTFIRGEKYYSLTPSSWHLHLPSLPARWMLQTQSLILTREEKASDTPLQKSMVMTYYAFLMPLPSPTSSHVPSCPRDEYIYMYACIRGFTVIEKRKELITSSFSTSYKCCKAEGTVFWNQIFKFDIQLYLITDPKCYFILLNSVILNININGILNS